MPRAISFLLLCLCSCSTLEVKKMPTAPSLDTSVCTDVPRWHIKNFGAIDTLLLDRPITLGYACVTDFCLELFKPSDNYIKPAEGTDYTLDRTAGTITFLSTSAHTWGQTGHGEEQWTMIAYFNDLPCEPDPECKTIECCDPDIHGYRSANATDSEAGSNEDCPEVIVNIAPIGGSTLVFPSYVVLTATAGDAVIRYTLDGTDPDEFSTLYTVPFQVDSASVIVKARGFIEGCSGGPVMTVGFQPASFQMAMAYACDTPDKAGTWDGWVPNGTVDNHWQLAFTLTALTTITRLELYQLDASGNWTTGIVWSTDSPINPDGGPDFDAFPLLVFVAAVQQWSAYQSSLGAFAAASYVWDLYGDRQFVVSGFFRLDMILGDGTKISQVIDATCTGVLPPTPCPSPALHTVVGKCDGAADVTFTGTVAQAYRIYTSTGSDGWTLASDGTIDASPKTVEITGLDECRLYYFRLDLEYADCGFQSGFQVQAATKCDPVVSITSDKLEVDPDETFTISWESNHIGGAVCGGCLDGEVSINQSIGCEPGNAAGSSVQSQAVAGVYTYTITGCNTCGTVVDSVQVTVREVAVCNSTPNPLHLADPTSFLCGFIYEGPGNCRSVAAWIPWSGDLWRSIAGGCTWDTAGQGSIMGGCVEDGAGPAIHVRLTFTTKYVLTVQWMFSCSETVWEGEKTHGATPLGVYTKTGGSATGPASITIT